MKRSFTYKRYKKLRFTVVILVLFYGAGISNAWSQTEALYSSYIFNGLTINPGYAGSKECLNMNLWGKRQWLGIEGAPSSVLLTAHTPLPNERMAVGMNIFNESWGVNRQTGISGVYAYRIPLKKDLYLSAGIQAGFINLSANFSTLTMKTGSDPSLSQNESRFIPDFAGGIFVHSKRFFAGASSAHLQGDLFSSGSEFDIIRRQFFITSGIVFPLSEDLKLKPSVLVRATEGSGIQGDANLNFLIREVLWAGVSYRTTGAFIFMTQMKLSQTFDFGYAFDLNTSLSRQQNFVSHEVMLNYRFSFRRSEITTPKYF